MRGLAGYVGKLATRRLGSHIRSEAEPFASEEQILNVLKKLGLGGRTFSGYELVETIQSRLPLPLDLSVVSNANRDGYQAELPERRVYGALHFDEDLSRLKLVRVARTEAMEDEDILLHEAAHLIRRHAIPTGYGTGPPGATMRFAVPPSIGNPLVHRKRIKTFELERDRAKRLIRWYERDAGVAANHIWLASRHGVEIYRRDEKLLGLC